MADNLIGKWQSMGFENIDPFWNAMGVSDAMRQFARDKTTELTIEKADGGWKLTTVAGDKSRVVTFPPGQEVDTITLMGEKVKAVLNETNGCLVEVQKAEVGDITIHRSLVDGNLKTKMTLKGITGGILFKKA
ncbi:hypothetical protein ACOMHN_038347 [Nucella lapillus]